jgi:pyruvate-formate lyase-activating enzyme
MKEIDQFHQELYMLYHYYMPDYDLQKIKGSAAELLRRMELIEKAKLPSRLTDKQPVFDLAKTDLKESLIRLQQAVGDKPEKDQVNKAIETVHDKYQNLVEIFE